MAELQVVGEHLSRPTDFSDEVSAEPGRLSVALRGSLRLTAWR
jgi:hypothetical protein